MMPFNKRGVLSVTAVQQNGVGSSEFVVLLLSMSNPGKFLTDKLVWLYSRYVCQKDRNSQSSDSLFFVFNHTLS